jgi:hypothetical protein
MTILDTLDNPQTWQDFLSYKQQKTHLTRREQAELASFIEQQDYRGVVRRIKAGEALSLPEKLSLNKLGTERKRVVYRFPADELWVLKLLAWQLFAYDANQPVGCYSFRRNFGAHRAIRDILCTPKIDDLWCCKLDISDYFNSIRSELLLPILAEVLADDPPLLEFFERLLTADACLIDGEVTTGPRGAMAGTPTAPFLANLYLREVDAWFTERGLPYARYSDDIIFFASTEQELRKARQAAEAIITHYGLSINRDKACISPPGTSWEFLGISYGLGIVDLSAATTAKIKGKIHRKGRALRRWMLRKDATPERAMRAFIRSFNRKFYDSRGGDELTWARWFFPLLTTSDSLHVVDNYLQQYARYIPTGRFNKANYRTDYAELKRLGYRSLVHEYYAFKERDLHR